MKLLYLNLIIVLLMGLSINVSAQKNAADALQMNKENHDFGKIVQGTPVSTYFEFKNITDKPLIVVSADASCGCTTPEKPNQPIMPGKTGKVKVTFDATTVSPFNKTISIKLAGYDQPKVVHILGTVVAK